MKIRILTAISGIILFVIVGLFFSLRANARVNNPLPLLSITTNITPTTNNSRDLGAFSSAFNELFVSGTSYIAGVSSTSGLYPTDANLYDIGSYPRPWRDLYVSSTGFFTNVSSSGYISIGLPSSIGLNNGDLNVGNTLNVSGGTTFSGAPLPNSNNNISLGAFGNSFRHIFASGTLFAATSTIVNSDSSSTLFMRSNVSGRGGQVILEDVDAAGCTAITVLDGVISGSTVTCPTE